MSLKLTPLICPVYASVCFTHQLEELLVVLAGLILEAPREEVRHDDLAAVADVDSSLFMGAEAERHVFENFFFNRFTLRSFAFR